DGDDGTHDLTQARTSFGIGVQGPAHDRFQPLDQPVQFEMPLSRTLGDLLRLPCAERKAPGPGEGHDRSPGEHVSGRGGGTTLETLGAEPGGARTTQT